MTKLRLLKNKNGTAEVIGSVMFIVILLFFFTNVYLWHDAATKEMNDLQVQKVEIRIDASIHYDGHNSILTITNNGATEASLAMLWASVQSTTGPDSNHLNFDLHNIVVKAGGSSITIPINYDPTGKTVIFKVITSVGTIEPCPLHA